MKLKLKNSFFKYKSPLLCFFAIFSFAISFPLVIPGDSEPIFLHKLLGNLAPFFFIPLLLEYLSTFKTTKRQILALFSVGFPANAIVFYWIYFSLHLYGGLGIFTSLIVLFLMFSGLTALFWLPFFLLTKFLEKRNKAFPHLIAGLWTLSQALRTFFPVDFYWADLGHSQYNNKFFIQWASIGSTYLITFMIVWISVLIYYWTKGKKPKKESFVLGLVFILLSIYSFVRIYEFNSIKNPQTIKVALLQANINQFEANSKIKKSSDIVKIYTNMLNKLDKDTDLVVWHEAAFPFAIPKGYTNFKKIWKNYFKKAPLFSQQIVGIDVVDYLRHKQYNSAGFIKNGKIAKVYNKIKLAPFGEYMPGESFLKLFGITQLVPSSVGSFARGKIHTVYDFGKFKASALICFDGTGSENVRDFVKNGANLLVSITNDAWFYYSSAAFQHFSFYPFRSVETGKTVIRSANIGISGYIYPDGSVYDATPIFKRTIINKRVKLYRMTSFYQKYGNLFLIFLMIYVFSTILREKYGKNSKS